MTNLHLRSTAPRTVRYIFCGILLHGTLSLAPRQQNQVIARAQSSSKQGTLTKTQKVANPLNDLLDEARRDMDENNFEAAISPLQKVIADQPEFADAHFQLGYV